MSLRVTSVVLFVLTVTVVSSAQQKCCTCRGPDRIFQIPQAAGCDIACSTNGGVSIGLKACMPIPQTKCGQYFQAFGGNCQGNQWCECGLTVRLMTPTPMVKQEVKVQIVSGNLGQEAGPLRHRTVLSGSVDWGDGSPKSALDTGDHILAHVYEKPGNYTVGAEIHGDFKWNGESGSSCSYRCRTAPASIAISVLGKSTSRGHKELPSSGSQLPLLALGGIGLLIIGSTLKVWTKQM